MGKRVQAPTPVVPGAPATSKELGKNVRYKTTGLDTQAIYDMMPYLTKALQGDITKQEQEKLAASQAVSPEYATLMKDIVAKNLPELAAIGNQITATNMLGGQEAINKVLSGPGAQSVASTLGLQKTLDQPYFDTRDLTGAKLGELINSIDLSGGLSTTERDEIARGLARENIAAGTYNTPSQLNTVSNAMRYGQAGYQRKQTALSNLSAALGQATSFLPQAKSGLNAFGIATAGTGVANPATQYLTGIKETSDTEAANKYGLANTMLGGLKSQTMQEAQIEANKKDAWDKFSQVMGGIGSVTGAVGGAVAACWVAREVFGEDNPKWMDFRNWLLMDAPAWFRGLYIKYGERFSKWIRNKPTLKFIVRSWMNYIIE